MKKIKRPLSIDFDGVIAEYDGWKGVSHYGNPMPGAKEFLEKLKSVGLGFSISTVRDIKSVRKWFEKYKMPFPKEITNKKIKAPVYIDDRSLSFDGDLFVHNNVKYGKSHEIRNIKSMMGQVDLPIIIKIAETINNDSIWLIIEREIKRRIKGRVSQIRRYSSVYLLDIDLDDDDD